MKSTLLLVTLVLVPGYTSARSLSDIVAEQEADLREAESIIRKSYPYPNWGAVRRSIARAANHAELLAGEATALEQRSAGIASRNQILEEQNGALTAEQKVLQDRVAALQSDSSRVSSEKNLLQMQNLRLDNETQRLRTWVIIMSFALAGMILMGVFIWARTKSATPSRNGLFKTRVGRKKKTRPPEIAALSDTEVAASMGSAKQSGSLSTDEAVDQDRDTALRWHNDIKGRPKLLGPTFARRSGPAPVFLVESREAEFFAVEISTKPELMNRGASGASRSSDNFYATWQDGPLFQGTSWQCPETVWERLRHASALYYRVWASKSAQAWVDARVSVKDEDLAETPALKIVEDE